MSDDEKIVEEMIKTTKEMVSTGQWGVDEIGFIKQVIDARVKELGDNHDNTPS